MKKLLSAAIATVMTATMSVSAFAATELTTSPSNNNGVGDYTIGVNGIYVAGANAAEKISVDIAWESMNFTYTAGDSSYDATTHKTTTKDGTWSTDKPGITVTNHSNAAIDATMSFAAAASGVVGTFYTKSGTDFTAITAAADQKLSLDSAEGTGQNPPKDTLYFGVSGAAIAENKSLGTVTVSLSGPVWTTVDSVETLKNALLAGGYVKLGANINLSERLELASAVSATLDLNGHTLTAPEGECAIRIQSEYNLTVQDTAGGGKIVSDDGTIAVKGTLCVKGGTICATGSDSDAVYVDDSGKLTVSGGVISGGLYGVDAPDNDTKLSITGGLITGRIAVNAYGNTTVSGGTLTGTVKAMQCSFDGSLTISGGTFNGDRGQTSQALSILDTTVSTISGGTFNGMVEITPDSHISGGTFNYFVGNGTGTLTITDGTFNDRVLNYNKGTVNISGGTFVGAIDNDDPGTVNVNGGVFTTDPTAFVPDDGYEVTVNLDNTYTVWKSVSDWNTLVSALTAGGYIKLNADITTGNSATFSSHVSAIFDLNGHRVMAESSVQNTFLTLGDGYSLTVFDSSAFAGSGAGKLIADYYNINSLITVKKGAALFANGGTFEADKNYSKTTISVEEFATVIVNGGKIIGKNAIESAGTVKIKGGTVSGDVSMTDNGTAIVTGGTFTDDPTSYIDTEKYIVTDNGDGTYTVSAKS